MLRAVFFDFDGLILDTETPEVTAWQQLYQAYGLDYPAEVWQKIVGRGPDQVAEQPSARLKRLSNRSDSVDEIHSEFREIYFQILKHEPQPGVVGLLEEIPVPKIIVSSSDLTWVKGHLEKLELSHFFVDFVTRERAARSKPAPDLYLEALNLHGLLPEEVVTFEDSENGLRAAVGAGIRTCVCPNQVTRHLDFSLAHRVVQSLEEVHWPVLI